METRIYIRKHFSSEMSVHQYNTSFKLKIGRTASLGEKTLSSEIKSQVDLKKNV